MDDSTPRAAARRDHAFHLPTDVSRSTPEAPAWDVWVDTGGTFTDCLARDPGGGISRAKVLSTSALRGMAEGSVDPVTLRVSVDWSGPPGLVDGFAFRSLGAVPVSATVVRHDPIARTLEVSQPVPEEALPFAFEVTSPEEAPILAARILTDTGSGQPLPRIRMRLATTRGTNALLERKGAPVAFFVTRGFADVLRIGTQQRPDLFTLAIERPEPLHSFVAEITGRLAADGTVVEALDESEVRAAATDAFAAGFRVAAVSLMHAHRNDAHERWVHEILREIGFEHVSRSAALAAAIGHLERSATAVANAYLHPVVSGYVSRVSDALDGDRGDSRSAPYLMTSSGGLVRAGDFRPKDSLLSGPAGGVVGAVAAARAAGFERVITFDMGGTSTDVARFDREFEYMWKHRVGDVELLAPALAIESVAAGGGSICGFGAGGLSVGPVSAGASPGPACYGAGGPLTITDCNLLLGRLDPASFPVPLDPGAAERRLEELAARIERADGARPGLEALLGGLIDIANERMADAIRAVSLRRGYDPTQDALVVFGGAGAQHGCGIAERLGIRSIIVPSDAGLLSARGLASARIERFAETQPLRVLDDTDPGGATAWLRETVEKLKRTALDAVAREGVDPARAGVTRCIANARLAGQDASIAIDLPDPSTIAAAFAAEYERTFGHPPDPRPIEVESLRVIAGELESEPVRWHLQSPRAGRETAERAVWLNGEWRRLPCVTRESLTAGAEFDGPCLVTDPYTAILVLPGWRGRTDESGAVILEAASREANPPAFGRARGSTAIASEPTTDAVREQLFASRFEGIVREMGEQLRRTAVSVNVKERLDFSCALLDPAGALVVNAPHIPVHLGALGICVRAVADHVPLRPGDVVVTNHPGFGGSHLPDITVITPVHDPAGRHLGYVASRAHHAEIGGSRPGSMPPSATTLVEEGVVIPPTHAIEGGIARWDRISALLTTGPYPSRAPADNLADLRAQVAANHRGVTLLRQLAAATDAAIVVGQMAAITARSEREIRAALRRLPDGRYAATEYLDDGSAIVATVTVRDDAATFDFAGTAAVHPGNLNATRAIVASAVLYTLRLLVDEPLPLNEGLLRPVTIRLPNSLLNPAFTGPPDRLPAVVGGNTEISQRLVDTLIAAFGLAASSQGTMNNVLWGTDSCGYYETIAGGEGAAEGHHGTSVVHTHMTNTRITDAEVLEHRFPVRLDRFAIRGGSGGAGRWRGGDGAIREVTFLAPMSLSVLTQRRREGPRGARGGAPGQPGSQEVIRRNGEIETLDSIDGREVEAGDRLRIQTPGGGGFEE